MNTKNYKINYKGSSKVIHRIVDKLNDWADIMLGTTHETAFYGDLGQTAYEHSQEQGNPHNLTLNDLDLGDLPRQLLLLQEAVGSIDNWADHDGVLFVDHDGDELYFSSASQLLAWH